MAKWKDVVLKVLQENFDKDKVLRSKWEVVRPENDEGKHFSPGLVKTGYYVKEGALTRGFPQILTSYDLNWIRDHWTEIRSAMDPAPASDPKPAQTPPPQNADIEEIPF